MRKFVIILFIGIFVIVIIVCLVNSDQVVENLLGNGEIFGDFMVFGWGGGEEFQF